MSTSKAAAKKSAVFFSVLLIMVFSGISTLLGAKAVKLSSPDKRLTVTVSIGDKIYYSVHYDTNPIITLSTISLTLNSGKIPGLNPGVIKTARRTINESIRPAVRQKRAIIHNHCNQLTLHFKGNYALRFRAYDDGAAYRFILKRKGTVTVESEEVNFQFSANHRIYFPTEQKRMTHQERMYEYIPVAGISPEKFSSLPALVDTEKGPKVLLAEADVEDYPGMYLKGTNSNGLTGMFPGVALKEAAVDLSRRGGDRNINVLQYADYIAVTSGRRSLPWRVLVIAETDARLIQNQMIFKLAKPLQLEDTSWIKPGKVAWDWWNDNNIYDVDFEAGLNTKTYKYYIDFAAKYGIPYIILDEGWYELGDLMKINPQINMDELMAYAGQKNVGIILWVVWKTLEDQMNEALDRFEAWGVKGIKVDFMQRDDQRIVNYYHRVAREAAKRKMLVDFHGSYTPKGLRRAYPNVITREGVMGLEHYKWKSEQGPEHEVTLPFIRMAVGPMDFTPGAMLNAREKSFAPIWQCPMSKGTRAHQLAMYVVYESPLQMLADSPTHYLKEPVCMEFLSRVPTVWDDTVVLRAKVGDYIALARRYGKEWYIGAMTDWTPREMELNLDFLEPGTSFTADIYADGINSHRNGNDFKRTTGTVKKGQVLKIHLAPGGGWAARIHN
jgi:alpha-glucosidase